MDMASPWESNALALITLTPTRRADQTDAAPTFDRFTQIGVLRAERLCPVDSLISNVRHHVFTICDEEELAILSHDYKNNAPRMEALVGPLCEILEGALPVSVNPKLVKKLLQDEFEIAEKNLGKTVDKSSLFALRRKSRWIDLGLWRRVVGDARAWPRLYAPPEEKLAVMLDRMKEYSASVVDRSWGVRALMDWQDAQVP